MNHIRVWDLPLRLFHWALAALVIVLIVTGQIGGAAMETHFLAGYGVLALLLFRLVWGFIGGATARFGHFVRGPGAIRAYLRGQWQRNGHNPLGAFSVLAMLGLLLLQVSAGLFANDDIASEGPLARFIAKEASDSVTWLHKEVGATALYVLIGLHVAAILYYWIVRKNNLVAPMITGMGRAQEDGEAVDDSGRQRALALFVFACVCGLVALLVRR